MLTEDWMMRQVEALARSIAYLVFQKEDTAYTPTGAAEDAEIDELYRTLLEKVNAGDIGGVFGLDEGPILIQRMNGTHRCFPFLEDESQRKNVERAEFFPGRSRLSVV